MLMPKNHIEILDKKITALSDALAHLGRGTTWKELLKIIHNPGYTTPAEFLFTQALIDAAQVHVNAMSSIETQIIEGAKQVGNRG